MHGSDYVPSHISEEELIDLVRVLPSRSDLKLKQVRELLLFLEEARKKYPQTMVRIMPFLLKEVGAIFNGYTQMINMCNASVKKRTRLLPPELHGRRVSAYSHHCSNLILYIIFRKGSSLRNPQLVPQKLACDFLAKLLLIFSLENPKVDKGRVRTRLLKRAKRDQYEELIPPTQTQCERAFEIERVSKLSELLAQRFRDWNAAQLPNMPRGQYFSNRKQFWSLQEKDIRRGQIRLSSPIGKKKVK